MTAVVCCVGTLIERSIHKQSSEFGFCMHVQSSGKKARKWEKSGKDFKSGFDSALICINLHSAIPNKEDDYHHHFYAALALIVQPTLYIWSTVALATLFFCCHLYKLDSSSDASCKNCICKRMQGRFVQLIENQLRGSRILCDSTSERVPDRFFRTVDFALPPIQKWHKKQKRLLFAPVLAV